jgi:hypothetical protein
MESKQEYQLKPGQLSSNSSYYTTKSTRITSHLYASKPSSLM